MKVLFILSSLILSTIAVRLPNGSPNLGFSDIQNSGSYSPVTFVVVPRRTGAYYPNSGSELENVFRQLYHEENSSRQSIPSVKTKRVIKLDDRFSSPYAIPRKKLNYRQTDNVPAQFLKEVTPTTMTVFEEQQQQQEEVPIYRFTETPTIVPAQSEGKEEAEAENDAPLIKETEAKVNAENLNQMRPIVFFQPDFNTMQLLQQAQEGLLNVESQDTRRGKFVSLNHFPKTKVPQKSPEKNQRPQVFSPSVNEDTNETTSRSTQTRAIPVLRQTHPTRIQFAFGDGQTYNKRYLGQLPQLIRELPFRYRLQLEQYNGKQDTRALQLPPYFNQAQLRGETYEEDSDVGQEVQTEVPVKQSAKLTNRKYYPNKIVQENENVNARINYQPQFFYPNYRYKLYPYTPNQYLLKNKQRTVQVLQDEDEEEEQGEVDEQ